MSAGSVWREVSLGDICEFKYGKSLPAKARVDGAYGVYGSNGVVGSHAEALTSGITIVIGRKGSFGEVHLSENSCWPIDTTYYIDESSTQCDLKWLSYRLASLGLTSLNRAATIPGLNRDDAYKKKLLLPPPDEQRSIVRILEQADTLRARRRESIALLDELTQSTFFDMFGDPATNPYDFPVYTIRDVASVGTGGTPSRENNSHFNGDIPWVKTTEVEWGVIDETRERITQEAVASARLKIHPRGSIVIALYGQGKTRGRCSLLGVEAAVNQACAVIHPNDDTFKNIFLYRLIQFSYERLRGMARGGNQANLNLKLIGDFPFMLPPLDRQRHYANLVEAIDTLKRNHQAHLAELDALFASLQHRAFRGEPWTEAITPVV